MLPTADTDGDLTNWTRPRATIASLIAHGRSADDPRVLAARRDMKAARLADYITKTVDAAPALSAEQRDRLALLLTSGGSDAA